MSTHQDVVTADELKRQRSERLTVLGQVIEMFWGTDQQPPTSDLIAMADWVLTGMPDIAQGNARLTAQNYEHREPT